MKKHLLKTAIGHCQMYCHSFGTVGLDPGAQVCHVGKDARLRVGGAAVDQAEGEDADQGGH